MTFSLQYELAAQKLCAPTCKTTCQDVMTRTNDSPSKSAPAVTVGKNSSIRQKELTTMKFNKLIALPILTVAFALAVAAPKANAANTTATLNVTNSATVSASASVSATVTLEDLQSSDEKDANDPIGLTVSTNNANGCAVTVAAGLGDAEDGNIAADDILIKSATGGSSISAFTPLTTSAVELWSTGSPVTNAPVTVDVRFRNLGNYPAAANGGNSIYTQTLTFTAVATSD
jgi:hypothetical protein